MARQARRTPAVSTSSAAEPQSVSAGPRLAAWQQALILVALVVLVFSPALRAGFIWDDDGFLTPRALRHASGLATVWTQPDATQGYYPLLHSLFWLEWRVFGDTPLPYHVVQLALHACAALLVWRLAARLAIPGAWFLGLLFALHPVQVETAAWVAEQKNTLSTCLYLSAWLAWLDFDAPRGFDASRASARPRYSRFVLSAGLALAAACSKSVTLTLAPAILLVTWWREGGRSWLARAPWLAAHFVPALALGLVTAWREVHVGGARGAEYELDLAQRCVIAGKDLWFYLGQLAWPVNTCFVYPRWDPAAFGARDWIAPIAFVALLAGAWILRARLGRGAFVALAFFAGTLAPALGFFDVIPFAYSFVADHFQYLACAGVLALGAAGVARLAQARRAVGIGTGAVVLAACGALSFVRAREFHDSPTLWEATVERNPKAWMAWENWMDGLNRAGRFDEALAIGERAQRELGERRGVLVQVGIALQQSGRPEEALAVFERAAALDPRSAVAQFNRGSALHALGRNEEALVALRRALELDERLALAHMLAGNALLALKRADEAVESYQRAAALAPEEPRVWFNFGTARLQRGEREMAVECYERALAIDPSTHDARFNLGIALALLGRKEAARAELERVARDAEGTSLQAQAREALRRLDAQ